MENTKAALQLMLKSGGFTQAKGMDFSLLAKASSRELIDSTLYKS